MVAGTIARKVDATEPIDASAASVVDEPAAECAAPVPGDAVFAAEPVVLAVEVLPAAACVADVVVDSPDLDLGKNEAYLRDSINLHPRPSVPTIQ